MDWCLTCTQWCPTSGCHTPPNQTTIRRWWWACCHPVEVKRIMEVGEAWLWHILPNIRTLTNSVPHKWMLCRETMLALHSAIALEGHLHHIPLTNIFLTVTFPRSHRQIWTMWQRITCIQVALISIIQTSHFVIGFFKNIYYTWCSKEGLWFTKYMWHVFFVYTLSFNCSKPSLYTCSKAFKSLAR